MKGAIASLILVSLVGFAASQQPALCGRPVTPPRNCSRSDRIVGGCEAAQHSWPWAIQLGKISTFFGTNYTQWICGGSIISPIHILTAAHCVSGSTQKPEVFLVKVGQHDTQRPSQYHKIHNVSAVHAHPDYDSRTIDNDVAIITLKEPIVMNNGVASVCLADTVCPTLGQSHTVVGWGEQNANGRATAQTLQQVDVKAWNSSTCNLPAHYGGKITNQMFCAGTTGKDSCQGDSGGPIVAEVGDSWVQNGVVSWGYGCAAANKPGVYTKICAPAIRNYIRSVIGW